ncbi:hypothetical protein H6P81_016324 [Aristolochia fimbriata]|uniref:Uncharacterized protein n=1 Tax=Aristolochia fimbriata TaxID=158543 RepID=A0AAV7E9P0_ARIFI|nr:hypothetical protein H6P81_016324 [Aristolochia fimbriata]
MKVNTLIMPENSSSTVLELVPDKQEEDELEKVLEEQKRNAPNSIKQRKEPSEEFELIFLDFVVLVNCGTSGVVVLVFYVFSWSRKDLSYKNWTGPGGSIALGRNQSPFRVRFRKIERQPENRPVCPTFAVKPRTGRPGGPVKTVGRGLT